MKSRCIQKFLLSCTFLCLGGLTGCGTAPLQSGGSLSSYEDMSSSDGALTRVRLRIEKDAVLAAQTVAIIPTTFSSGASKAELSERQRKIVANAVDRSLCLGLSDRFRIVRQGELADLTVKALVTDVTPTNAVMAGVSNTVGIVPSLLSLGFPVPVPRIPVGLGTLSLEAEARDRTGVQKASILWARAANSLAGKARVSAAGDPYELASAFGDDLSNFLVTGESPFKKVGPSLPSFERLSSRLGGKAKEAACEVFGREGGVTGLVAGGLGLPPEWSDDGPGDAIARARNEAFQHDPK